MRYPLEDHKPGEAAKVAAFGMDKRPWTDPVKTEHGTRITVKRVCEACHREVGDATQAECEAAMYGAPLPTVAAEHGCHVNPDCRGGKHPACNGDAWDNETDSPAGCDCACHTGVA